MLQAISLLFDLAAVVGCAYALATAVIVARRRAVPPVLEKHPPVTLLKPLHGDEPLLLENLRSFCVQRYNGPVQIVFGVATPEDGALAAVRQLQEAVPDVRIDVVVDERRRGINPKMANLINMAGHVQHDIIVLSDSDIRVPENYLAAVVGTLLDSRAGAVTCLYQGLGVTGAWSRLAAAAINMQFLPSVLFGVAAGLAQPCFGSTIALERGTLARIGGFAGFADRLADDYAIGAAVRALGLAVLIAPVTVVHVCTETTFGALFRHELRWSRTIRLIDPVGYAGSGLTHPLALALVAWATGGGSVSLLIVVLALGCQLFQCTQIYAALGRRADGYWLIPVRALLSFMVYLASYAGREVDWQGQHYGVEADGSLTPEAGRGSWP